MALISSYYSRLLNILAPLYPLQADVQRVALAMEVPREKLILTGTGESMWDSLLSYIDRRQAQADLLAFVLKEYPDTPSLRDMLSSLKNGSAFINEVDPQTAGANRGSHKGFRILSLYDHNDEEEFVLPMLNQLRLLKMTYPDIELDSVRTIQGGVSVKDASIKQLAKASLVLLFITGYFFGNVENQCWPLTLDALRLGKRTVPLLMEVCLWSRVRVLEDIQPLPRNRIFISQWKNRNEGFAQIAGEIERIVKQDKDP